MTEVKQRNAPTYLSQKIHLQLLALVNAPPNTGPKTPAMEMTVPIIGASTFLRRTGDTSGNIIIVKENLAAVSLDPFER